MNRTIYKYYDKTTDRKQIKDDMEQFNKDNALLVSFVSGSEPIMNVIEKLIKSQVK